ncbi:MAG: hypothetical protein HQ579_05180, partial [Candidatus Omnitrophica bacterium]|nr:hypothetical protein [Candidatus Omnitrophota bacterium]
MNFLKLCVIILLFSLIISYAITEIYCLDVWLHLKTGEHILKTKTIPHHDIFSYTVPGKHWIDHEWLSQVIFYSTYNAFGPNGLIVLRVFIIAGTFLLLFLFGYRKENYLLVSILLLAVLFLSEGRFMIRPGLFTIFFTALFLVILTRYRSTRLLYVLPVAQLFWVNLHGYFFIGVLFMLVYSIVEIIKKKDHFSKRLITATLLVVAASFINPYGWKGAMYPVLTLFGYIKGDHTVFLNRISELRPLITQNKIRLPYLIMPWLKIIIIVSGLSFLVNFRKTNISNFIIYIIALAIALKTSRNIAIFSIVAYVVTISNINDIYDTSIKFTRFRKIEKLLKILFAITLVLFMSTLLFGNLKREYYSFEQKKFKKFYLDTSSFSYPEKAVDFIKENNIKGNILNDFNSGAYLIWRLFPEKKVFIDGRTEVYGPEFFKECEKIFQDKKKLKKITSRYKINCILITYVLNMPIPKSILKFLYEHEDWALVYLD